MASEMTQPEVWGVNDCLSFAFPGLDRSVSPVFAARSPQRTIALATQRYGSLEAAWRELLAHSGYVESEFDSVMMDDAADLYLGEDERYGWTLARVVGGFMRIRNSQGLVRPVWAAPPTYWRRAECQA